MASYFRNFVRYKSMFFFNMDIHNFTFGLKLASHSSFHTIPYAAVISQGSCQASSTASSSPPWYMLVRFKVVLPPHMYPLHLQISDSLKL
jgi:hypothetical protein